ncbi:MAG TPA: PIN domain-containing protein [Candidatus Nanoarchaeia archaeon]|nr:PIN domain-containing protein [Candidatus Nanoarchaeia archaeon]
MSLEVNSITIEPARIAEPIFFFDTYAFYEIIKGNSHYQKYIGAGIVTTKLNVFELYFTFLKEGKTDLASISFTTYYPFVKEFGEQVIKEAAHLKLSLNKRDVSMTDCIGYCMAQQLGILFLTGDPAFEQLDNVEFVV